ncbi:MAG: Flp pilus assembly protein CpaB [Gemmatimonadaceae bacterium]
MAERRYTVVFLAAVLTAGLATFGVYRVLERTKDAARIETRPVVVAAEDLSQGAEVSRTSVSVAQWPLATVPDGAYGSLDSVVGRVARVAVFKGEPIVPGRLAPEGTGPGIEVKIAPGKRAMAVKINEVAGVSGLIQPNSRVDVLVSLKDGNSNDRQVAKVFMSNMRVLSVGTQVERGEDGKAIQATTAALEVTPDEAEQLAVATNQGTIQLVLRGYGDPDSISTQGARSEDVLRMLRGAPVAQPPRPAPAPVRRVSRPAPRPAPPPVVREPVYVPPPPPRPESLTVRVIRGDKVTQEKVERTGPASGSTSTSGTTSGTRPPPGR